VTSVRHGRPADLPALEPARATLSEPSDLLETVAGTDGPLEFLVAVGRPDDTTATRPVGYVVVVPGPNVVYVPELAVRPDSQRRGHGSALLSRVLERARALDVEQVRLTVAVSNDTARAFYREHGFTVSERVSDRFEDDDGLVLVNSV
jgi:ribosomal protein S18 acetylase RimI-like enzyme